MAVDRTTGASRAAIGAAALLVALEAVALVRRGGAGESDVGVFYRTCELLRNGVRAIYPRIDAGTGWPISMPPLGFAIFQPFSTLGLFWSMVGWAALNLALLGVSVVILKRVLLRTGDDRYARAFPWAVTLLLVLAAGSVQVGQFSVLFVTCWLLFIEAFTRGRRTASAIWLALPAAVKIYPAAIVAAPLSALLALNVDRPGRWIRQSFVYGVIVVAAIVVLWVGVPALAYGTDTFGLNVNWWRGVILNHAQMDYLQSLRAITNQSLDIVLLRFLSYDPAFHDHYPLIPHLAIAKATVLQIANVGRLAIIATSGIAVWRGARTRAARGLRGAEVTAGQVIGLTALWVATLYNIVPETKARYAVYTFIAFLPWLARAMDAARPRGRRVADGCVIAGSAICALVFLPDTLQAWGVGFIGPVVLWIGNVRFVASGGDRSA